MTTSIKILIKFNFGLELLAQGILPCVKDLDKNYKPNVVVLTFPYICASVFGLKLAPMLELELWESNNY